MPAIIERFKSGVKVDITPDPVFPHWGLSQPIVGRLSMPDDQIEANIQAIVEAVCKHRTPALGHFINRAVMMVIPGTMYFPIDIERFYPVATEEELDKLEKRKSGKKKKKEESVQKEVNKVEESDDLIAIM